MTVKSTARNAARLLTVSLVTVGTSLVLVPVAQAEDLKVTPTLESWYQPDPTCAQATGCLTGTPLPLTPPIDIPTSPYPAGTMHVGYASSAETARTYLTFPFTNVTGAITGAVLDVPLDVDPANGSAVPETAKLQACLATGDLIPTQGSLSAPPSVDCSQHAVVKYVATPTPHLTADLKPLLLGLPTTSGIALLPDAEALAETPTDAWRVVFSSHDRADAAKTPPAVLSLTMTSEAVSTPVVEEVPVVSSPELGGVVTTPDLGSGFVAAPPVDAGVVAPSVDAPTVTPQAGQPQVVPQAAETVTFGYQYPVVWLLPLALLVLAPMAARALTKDLEVPPPADHPES